MLAAFYAIIALVTLFIILHLFTELKKQDKIVIVSVVAVMIISAIWYERSNNAKRTQTHNLVLKFKQGENLKCGDVLVNNKNFNYVSHTFIALEDSKFKGFIISEKQCK